MMVASYPRLWMCLLNAAHFSLPDPQVVLRRTGILGGGIADKIPKLTLLARRLGENGKTTRKRLWPRVRIPRGVQVDLHRWGIGLSEGGMICFARKSDSRPRRKTFGPQDTEKMHY